MPTPPIPVEPPSDWQHIALFRRIEAALFALPSYFHSQISITGIRATDIQTLNTAFGAAIEDQVVHVLNEMRQMWDVSRDYLEYTFVRQPQTFPDVLLRRASDPSDIIMGVELKGWYLLAKEREPSFRFSDSPVEDKGGNFGRLARTGIMDDFLGLAERELIAGIEAKYWRDFFKIFTEKATASAVESALSNLGSRIAAETGNSDDEEAANAIRDKLLAIISVLFE